MAPSKTEDGNTEVALLKAKSGGKGKTKKGSTKTGKGSEDGKGKTSKGKNVEAVKGGGKKGEGGVEAAKGGKKGTNGSPTKGCKKGKHDDTTAAKGSKKGGVDDKVDPEDVKKGAPALEEVGKVGKGGKKGNHVASKGGGKKGKGENVGAGKGKGKTGADDQAGKGGGKTSKGDRVEAKGKGKTNNTKGEDSRSKSNCPESAQSSKRERPESEARVIPFTAPLLFDLNKTSLAGVGTGYYNTTSKESPWHTNRTITRHVVFLFASCEWSMST